MSDTVRFPFGDAPIIDLAAAGTQDLIISNIKTIVQNGTPIAAAITALDIIGSPDLPVGAEIFFDILQGATGYDITFASNEDTVIAPVLTGVANDRDVLKLVWNGSAWVAEAAAWAKIKDAV